MTQWTGQLKPHFDKLCQALCLHYYLVNRSEGSASLKLQLSFSTGYNNKDIVIHIIYTLDVHKGVLNSALS